METKFERPSVIRQSNAFKSQRQSILGKPATFSDSLAKKDFSKSKSVTTNNLSNDFSKQDTAQILSQNVKSILKNTNMIAPGMTKQPIAVPISIREPKRTVNQFVATSLKKTIASASTNQKPRSKFRKQYEQISKTYKWWCSTLSITPLSSNSFAAHRDNSIHRRLWVLKAHDGKSHASKENDLLQVSRDSGICISITLQDTSTPNPIFLMAKATSSQACATGKCRILHEIAVKFDCLKSVSIRNMVVSPSDLKRLAKTRCVNANDKANRMLRAKAIECISLVEMAVGKDKFRDDAKQISVRSIVDEIKQVIAAVQAERENEPRGPTLKILMQRKESYLKRKMNKKKKSAIWLGG
ncbi:retrovirus-related pol polyprotein from transposon TNT 1-94 [Tanacetum coccineum]|uniref:Retrovirus-related pol polyprotein from transposon TNT 1-94 n=1 Tax=Tanacetum coccineum TaxID=301880 RepID=A0ABQ4XNH7_9ASTR